jgi:hypothetical protein
MAEPSDNTPEVKEGLLSEDEANCPGDEEGYLTPTAYLEHRKTLIDGEAEAIQSFDKTLVTLSAGAFGISLVFIVQVAPDPVSVRLLVLAWVALLGSLASVLSSFLCSQYGFRRAVRILDSMQKGGAKENNGWNVVTGLLNVVSISTFIAGVIFLACFAVRNVT